MLNFTTCDSLEISSGSKPGNPGILCRMHNVDQRQREKTTGSVRKGHKWKWLKSKGILI